MGLLDLVVEIEVRAEKATRGPWGTDWDTQRYHRDGYDWCTFAIGPQHGCPGDPTEAGYVEACRLRDADVAFIADARTTVPRLCKALRVLAEACIYPDRTCDDALAAAEAALRGEGE